MPKRRKDEPSIDIENADAPQLGVDPSDDEYDDGAAASANLKKLRNELAKCKEERQEYLDGWQRLRADVANARRAEGERAARSNQAAKAELITELLPVLDSFDMAMQGIGWEGLDQNWRRGIEYTIAQLESVITNAGATRYGEQGDAFDPRLHEAVKEVPASEDTEDGTIFAILRSGWKMGESILRPAQVIVAHKS